jgi:hypothetical protein
LLAQQRASGALEIAGNPGGMVFLSGGYLTYAESPAIPDLRTRLIRSQRISAEAWNEIIASDGDRGGVGALLVSEDVVSRVELRKLLWSVALDTLVALTLPVRAGPLAGVRFWPRRSPWVGSLLRLDVASVWDDVSRKAERLMRREIPAEGCPQLRPMTRPWAVVNSEQWAVAWQFDGLATVRDVAWRNGYALYDTLEWVGDLVQAGLCTVVPPIGIAPAVTAPAVTALPLRQRGESLPERSGDAETPAVPQWRADDVPRPPGTSHPDLLHRILGSLKRDDLMPATARGPRLRLPVQAARQRAQVTPPGELGRVRGDAPDHVPHLVVQHADVELVVPQHGHDGVGPGRVHHQVAGAAARYRLAEPAPAGRVGGLAGQSEGRRHDGRDPGRFHVGDVVRDQQPVTGGDQAAVDADHAVAQRPQFGEDPVLDRDLPGEWLVHRFPPMNIGPP